MKWSYKTIKRIYLTAVAAELLLFFVAMMKNSAESRPYLISAIVSAALNTAFAWKFLRCPHCGMHQIRALGITCCPRCGEELEAEPKGGNFD